MLENLIYYLFFFNYNNTLRGSIADGFLFIKNFMKLQNLALQFFLIDRFNSIFASNTTF